MHNAYAFEFGVIDGEGRFFFGGGVVDDGFGVFVAHCFLTTDSITGYV